jgi:hypothetical protein
MKKKVDIGKILSAVEKMSRRLFSFIATAGKYKTPGIVKGVGGFYFQWLAALSRFRAAIRNRKECVKNQRGSRSFFDGVTVLLSSSTKSQASLNF